MPTYDYVCGACGHLVEVMHGVHDHGPVECPNCHARAMRKAIVSPTVLYKGSGWAKKDRGASASTKAARAAASGDSGGSGGSGGSDSDKSAGSDKGDQGPDKGSDKSADTGSGPSNSGASTSAASTSPSKGD